jgi:polyhydroxybutyrate depolymerase
MRQKVVGMAMVAPLVASALLGCDTRGSGSSERAPSFGTPVLGASSIVSDGIRRTYELVRPPGVNAPAPLVIMLHGARSEGLGRGLRGTLELDDPAAATGVVTVYPDGDLATHSWHAGCCYDEAAEPVDVHYISDLIDRLVATGVADPQHVVVGGFSAGAFLAGELACRLADKITGVVVLAGTQLRPPPFVDQVVDPPIAPCVPDRPVSRIAITGTDDNTVPIDGRSSCAVDPCGPGQRGYSAPLADVDAWWRRLDDCQPRTTGSVRTGSTTSATSLAQCADGTVVGYAEVNGAPHSAAELRAGFDVAQTIVELALGRPLTTVGIS